MILLKDFYLDIKEIFERGKSNKGEIDFFTSQFEDNTKYEHYIYDGLHFYNNLTNKERCRISKEKIYDEKGKIIGGSVYVTLTIDEEKNKFGCALQCIDPGYYKIFKDRFLFYILYNNLENKIDIYLPPSDHIPGRTQVELYENKNINSTNKYIDELLDMEYNGADKGSMIKEKYKEALDFVKELFARAEKENGNLDKEQIEIKNDEMPGKTYLKDLTSLSIEELQKMLETIKKGNSEKSGIIEGIEQNLKAKLLEEIRAAQKEGVSLDKRLEFLQTNNGLVK